MSEGTKKPEVVGKLSGIARGTDDADEDTGTAHPEMFVLPSSGPHGTQRLDLVATQVLSTESSPQAAPPAAPPPAKRPGGHDEGDDLATRVVDHDVYAKGRPAAPRPAAGTAAAPAENRAASPSGFHVSASTRRKATRRALAIEAVVTTPQGDRHVLQTIDASSRGLLLGSSQTQIDVRPGWTCQVLLVHGTVTVDFDAEVVRVVDPSETPGFASAFALQVVMLTRDQQERLHTVLSHAMEQGGGRASGAPLLTPQRVKVALIALLATLICAVAALLGVALLTRTRVPVTVVHAARAPIDDVATSLPPGEVIAAQRVTVRSTLPGPKVIRLEVAQGQRVRAGDVLARSHDATIEDVIGRAHSRMTNAEAIYRRARDEAAAMRNRNLPGTDISESEDALARARAQMVDARSSLDTATAELKRNQIEAPFDGVVAELLVHNGELLEPAAPVLDLIDDTIFRARVSFDEAAAGRMHVGARAQIWLPGATSPVGAKIESIGDVVHAGAEGKRVVPVELTFPPNVELRVGASARAEVVVNHRDGVLCVPTHALLGSGTERQIYVVKGDRAELRTVSIGTVQDDLTEVKAGLDEDARVILTPPATLTPNARIEAHEIH